MNIMLWRRMKGGRTGPGPWIASHGSSRFVALAGFLLAGLACRETACANTTNSVPYAESFEAAAYTNGFALAGTNGWAAQQDTAGTISTDAAVLTALTNYAGTFPLQGESHDKVLQVTDEITDAVLGTTGGVVIADFMALPSCPEWEPPGDTNWQYAFYLNASSNLVVWHQNQVGAPTNEWRVLTNGPTLTPGVWARFTVVQDYGHGLFQIRVNQGAWITDSAGWTAGGATNPGSWFHMVQTNRVMSLFGMGTMATNYVDDMAITTRAVTWSTNRFGESLTNNGTMDNSAPLLVGLLYDTFSGTNGEVFGTNKVQVSNLPSNLAAVVTLSSATQLTVRIAGTAVAHEDSDDVTNVTISLQDTAFALGNVADVAGAARSDLVCDFRDTPHLAYSRVGFAEATANDGSIDNASPLLITLTNALFAGALGEDFAADPGKVQIVNLPSNLVAAIVLTNRTQLSVRLDGQAVAHTLGDNVSNLTFVFQDGAFSNTPWYGVDGAARTNLSIQFLNPTQTPELQYGSTTFMETTTNDGSVAGTTLTLVAKDFAGTNGENFVATARVSVTNVPDGLSVRLVRNGLHDMVLSFGGRATAHSGGNSVTNLTVQFKDTAFAGGGSASVSNAYRTDLSITFRDPPVLGCPQTRFAESVTNNGAISNSLAITLSGGETFAAGPFVENTHFTVSGVPTGLVFGLTRDSDTQVTVSLGGKATSHGASDSVTNLHLTFLNPAFSMVPAADVNGHPIDFAVDFRDPPQLSCPQTHFAEGPPNVGTIGNSLTVTLSGGETFAAGPFVQNTHFTVSGVPTGLIFALTRDSDTQVTATLGGTAEVHTAAGSVTNLHLTFLDPAFTAVSATNVSGHPIDFAVDFWNSAAVAYSTDAFIESSLGAIDNSSPITIDLEGDTFTGVDGSDFVAASKATVTHLPGGLTATVVKNSDTQLCVRLEGAAYYHGSADDVTNLTVQFGSAAFASVPAALVTGSLKSDLEVRFQDETAFAYPVPYEEPFESYTNGHWMMLTRGWTAEHADAAVVVADASIVGGAHQFLEGALPIVTNHAQSLRVLSDLQVEIHSAPEERVYLDFMSLPVPMVDAPQVDTNMQFAFYVSTNSQLVIWHQNRTGGVTNNELRVLSNAPPLDTNRWVRFTVCQDYSNAMFEVRINNGRPITDGAGWTGPGGAEGGSWFYMVRTNSSMSRFGIAGVGSGYIDDLTVRPNRLNTTCGSGNIYRFR